MDQHELQKQIDDGGLVFGTACYLVEKIRDGRDGPVVVDRRQVDNLVVSVGKKNILRLAAALTTKDLGNMRIGTSGAAAASNQSNVLTPVSSTLTAVDSKTMSGRTLVVVNSYASGTGTISATGIREVAILSTNTSPGGSMFSRAVFTAVNKTTSDKLKITYKVRIT